MKLIIQNEAITLSWIKAFNDKNLIDLLNLYDARALHFSPKLKARQPETNGFIVGRKAMEAWWQDAFKRLPSLSYTLKNSVITENTVVMEYLREVKGEDSMMVAEFLEIENGLIVKSRVYHS